jgi:replicative DNA helicase
MEYRIEDAQQSERAVLGAILASPEKVYEAMTLLSIQDFTPPNDRVFGACVDIANRGGAPDISAVDDHLTSKGQLDSVGGFSQLVDYCKFGAMNLRDTCKRVREHGHRRKLLHICEAVQGALQSGAPVDDCLTEAESGLLSIRANNAQGRVFHVKDFALKVVDDLFAIKKRGPELIGLTTGVRCIDNATSGIRPGELWIVGALPGRGKTALGVQIAAANAQAGVPTLVFSLEMAKELLMHRILADHAGVSSSKIRNPQFLNETDLVKLQETAAGCVEWPLYVDESSQLDANELVARAKLYVRRHGVKLIVVDYLRLIKSSGRELREQVANAADCLRRIAKDENVAVLGLSQLKRPQNINDRPSMIDLKESGDIEAHAHVCLLLYQPINAQGDFTHEDEIIIGKHRNGPLGSEKVLFDHNTLTFKDRES